jgi:hypothetical protein
VRVESGERGGVPGTDDLPDTGSDADRDMPGAEERFIRGGGDMAPSGLRTRV